MLPVLCLSCRSADSIFKGRGLPAAGFLVPAEIRVSQAMRRPSNILTRDGEEQWSGCVCVNTSSLNTHMCKETPSPLNPFLLPEHAHRNTHTCTLFTNAPELILQHIFLPSGHLYNFTMKKERTESKGRVFKGLHWLYVVNYNLTIVNIIADHFPKQNWCFNIDWLSSRQPVVVFI